MRGVLGTAGRVGSPLPKHNNAYIRSLHVRTCFDRPRLVLVQEGKGVLSSYTQRPVRVRQRSDEALDVIRILAATTNH